MLNKKITVTLIFLCPFKGIYTLQSSIFFISFAQKFCKVACCIFELCPTILDNTEHVYMHNIPLNCQFCQYLYFIVIHNILPQNHITTEMQKLLYIQYIGENFIILPYLLSEVLSLFQSTANVKIFPKCYSKPFFACINS